MDASDSRGVATLALASLDLTSLNDDDTPTAIDSLCDRALAPAPGLTGHPAAVCVYPRFARQCVARLRGSGVRVAVVTNFPSGDEPLDTVLAVTQAALVDGANEVDVVLPFRSYLTGTSDTTVVQEVGELCHAHGALLKVILETGALSDTELIKLAALDSVTAGADFVKTSTGKVEPGATPEAARAMLEVIADMRDSGGRAVGLKVSGGVRTVADAGMYLALASDFLGDVHPGNFRIGASGLLNDIVRVLTGETGHHDDARGY